MQFNSDKIRTAAGKLLQSLRKCAAALLSIIRAAGGLMKTLAGGLSAIGRKACASKGRLAEYGQKAAAAAGKIPGAARRLSGRAASFFSTLGKKAASAAGGLPSLGEKISSGAKRCLTSVRAGARSLSGKAAGSRKAKTAVERKPLEASSSDGNRAEAPAPGANRPEALPPAVKTERKPVVPVSSAGAARKKKNKKPVRRAEGKYTKRRRRNLRERRLSAIAAGSAVLLLIMAAVFAAVALFGPQMREPAEVSTSVSTEGNEAFRGEREGAEKIPFGTSFRGLTESSRENLSGIRRQMEESLREEYMQILDRGEGDSFHTASAAGNKLWKKVRRERKAELRKDPLLILVNKWHYLPEDYEVEPVDLPNGQRIGSICYEQLEQMLADCAEAGGTPIVCSGYRPHWYQVNLFDAQIDRWLYAGYGQEEAEAYAATAVAIPGTSEHELGLAADIYSSENMDLDESQVNTFTQQWLMENSWRYGFVLRYPQDKSDITGIIFEPWHYRYVGKKHAKKIFDAGICLEEYLDETEHP